MRKLIIIAGALGVSSAFANPTIYPSKPGVLEKVITSDQINSTVIMDTKDDNVFYVLPPKTATASASGISVANTNLGFCEDIANIQSAGHFISAKLKQLSEEQQALQPELRSAEQKLDKSKGLLSAYNKTNDVASQFSNIDNEIRKNNTRLDALYTKADKCSTATGCDSIHQEIDEIQNSNTQLETSKQKIVDINVDVVNKIAEYEAQVNADNDSLNRVTTRFSTLTSSKAQALKAYKELYMIYADLEGGTASLKFDGGWNKQISLLRSLNHGKSFTAVATHNVKLFAAILGESNGNDKIRPSAIIDSVVNGKYNKNEEMEFNSFPDSFVANVRLSLAGACPIVLPEKFPHSGIESGKIRFGVSASYQFDAAFHAKIDCAYDEKEVMTKILNSGSSGFLFWKRNWESIDLSNVKTTEFMCNWENSLSSAMTSADRRKFEIDALNYAISRMLLKYATPQDVSPTLPPKPTSGLSEMGAGLWSLCGTFNIYCRAGSWLLKSTDAIFGSGQSSGSGRNTTESKVRMRWDENLMNPVDAQTNFNAE